MNSESMPFLVTAEQIVETEVTEHCTFIQERSVYIVNSLPKLS